MIVYDFVEGILKNFIFLVFSCILPENSSKIAYHSYDEGAHTKKYIISEEFSTKIHGKLRKNNMKTQVINIDGKKTIDIEISDSIFSLNLHIDF